MNDKQSNRRLLDMLVGWQAHLDKIAETAHRDDVDIEEYEQEADFVANLYQEAGRKDFAKAERREFILSRILPWLEGE